MALITTHVYIDTEYFVRMGLDFKARVFEEFAEIASTGDLDLLITQITKQEVVRKICESVNDALKAVHQIKRKSKVLAYSSQSQLSGIFRHIDHGTAEREAIRMFNDFLSRCAATTVYLDNVNADQIFSDYFRQRPPFQSGQKKNEFRDAFTLAAIVSKLPGGGKCYVVSKDDDFSRFASANDALIVVHELDEVLDLYLTHEDERSNSVKKYLQRHKDRIKSKIRGRIEQAGLYNLSSWDDAEIVDHKINEIDDFEPKIVRISDEECVATFPAIVHFWVKVRGPDFNNGMYDREEGVVYPAGFVEFDTNDYLEVDVEIELNIGISDGQFLVLDDRVSVLGIDGGIELSIEENDQFSS